MYEFVRRDRNTIYDIIFHIISVCKQRAVDFFANYHVEAYIVYYSHSIFFVGKDFFFFSVCLRLLYYSFCDGRQMHLHASAACFRMPADVYTVLMPDSLPLSK